MAQRRMFSLKVVDTDAFCEMPASAQNLYFHIGMRADDEGFYAGVRGLMAKIHASQDDLSVLIARRYILDRGDGVYVIKHWKMNNYLQIDRIKPTEYEEKRIGLYVKKDGSYTLDPLKSANPQAVKTTPTIHCIQNVSIDKNSIVENSLDIVENSSEENNNLDCYGERKYAYTREQIEKSGTAAEECLRMRERMSKGIDVGEAWVNTLTDFAEAIQSYEDGKRF